MSAGPFDVLVMGAGPAGLGAALILGRCRLRVVICDGGRQRNRMSEAIHGLLGHEGTAPTKFLGKARREIEAYPTLTMRSTEVVSILGSVGGFSFRCSDGSSGRAQRVLLATGLRDEVPDVPGLESLYGRSVHHCLYCDGYEYSDGQLAAYGQGEKGPALALMMLHWSPHVTLFTDGSDLTEDDAGRMAAHAIPVCRQPIARLEGNDGRLSRIVLRDGRAIDCDAMFFSTGCGQQSDLWRSLGCIRDEKGGLVADPLTGETSTAGVYAAGDVSRDVLLVACAIAEGVKAAIAIHRALLRERGLL